ncbi:MAG: damage-inducible protein DinB [Rhodobacteraceae bacterium]|nr:MAG: damage-inducible protein DinB [Paracoccaceae bacterium]
MIEPVFCRVMARYNMWQNGSQLTAADKLDESSRKKDRGAFFGSIQGTMNHLLWADRMWMSRLDGWSKPEGGTAESTAATADWDSLKNERYIADTRILDWALRLSVGDLDGDLVWFSGMLQSDVRKPKWLCVQHFFNHQTHHRGQIHAMLTAARALPEDTDLFLMPEGE